MKKGLILIGAGTRGGRRIGSDFQPFVVIEGRTCVEIVLDAVTKTDNDFPIYLWGPEERLKEVLSSIIKREKDRREIRIFPEKSGPIDSLLFLCGKAAGLPAENLFFDEDCLKQACGEGDDRWPPIFFLPSDIPLITSEEIDFLMKNADVSSDLLMGWSVRQGFDTVLSGIRNESPNIDLSRTKFNFSRFMVKGELYEARFNNTYHGRPLQVDLNLYRLFHVIYENRNLIRKIKHHGRETKKLDVGAISRWLKAFGRYLRTRKQVLGPKAYLYGYLILNTYFHSLGLEGKHYPFLRGFFRCLSLVDRRSPGTYIEKSFFESNILKLTGNRIGMYLSNLVGPIFDIDIEYEYEFLKKNFGRLRDRIDNYYATFGMKKLP